MICLAARSFPLDFFWIDSELYLCLQIFCRPFSGLKMRESVCLQESFTVQLLGRSRKTIFFRSGRFLFVFDFNSNRKGMSYQFFFLDCSRTFSFRLSKRLFPSLLLMQSKAS